MAIILAIAVDALGFILAVPVLLGVAALGLFFFWTRYKVVQANEVLVISGGREKARKDKGAAGPATVIPDDSRRKKSSIRILRAGGAFVSPLKKWNKFSLSVMTIQSEGQTTQSSVVVPVIVRWTAQIKADDRTDESLETAITNFLGFKREDIEDALKQSLDGEIRAVIGTKTPEEIVTDKNSFGQEVRDGVQEKMEELGFRLLSLNIAEVTDPEDYYVNLAARDREEKRQEAQKVKAEADKEIMTKQAQTGQASQSAVLEAELAVAGKQRDVNVQRAGYRTEVAAADAKADYAKQLNDEEQKKTLATRQGAVAVEQAEQGQRVAEAQRNIVTTQAETEKQRLEIEANAAAEKAKIEAAARVVIAERDADAEAKANERTAEGRAVAKKTEAEAEAEYIQMTRLANAKGIEAEAEAEAAGIKAKLLAEAEGQKALADALAANDKVNLEVRLAEIQRDTTITVATNLGEIMAKIGENATFIDMGGGAGFGSSGGGGGGGDLLTNVLSGIPRLLKQLDVQSEALNNVPFLTALNGLSTALTNSEPVYAPQDEPVPLPDVEPKPEIVAERVIEAEPASEPMPTTDEPIEPSGPTTIQPAESVPAVERASYQSAAELLGVRSAATTPPAPTAPTAPAAPTAAAVEPSVTLEAAVPPPQTDSLVYPDETALTPEQIEIPATVSGMISRIQESHKLDIDTAADIAEVYQELAADGTFDNMRLVEIHPYLDKTAEVIKELQASGERVSPRSIAKTLASQSGEDLSASGVVKLLVNRIKNRASSERTR